MTWVFVAVGWALCFALFLALCCAATDGDQAANLLLTRSELDSEQHDRFEMGVLVSMEDYR